MSTPLERAIIGFFNELTKLLRIVNEKVEEDRRKSVSTSKPIR